MSSNSVIYYSTSNKNNNDAGKTLVASSTKIISHHIISILQILVIPLKWFAVFNTANYMVIIKMQILQMFEYAWLQPKIKYAYVHITYGVFFYWSHILEYFVITNFLMLSLLKDFCYSDISSLNPNTYIRRRK